MKGGGKDVRREGWSKRRENNGMKGKEKGNNIKERLTISKYCKAVDKQKNLYFAWKRVPERHPFLLY